MSPLRVVLSRTLLCLLASCGTAARAREVEPYIAEPLPLISGLSKPCSSIWRARRW